MEEGAKSLVVNKQQLKNAIYVNVIANKDQQCLIKKFVKTIVDNFDNEEIVVNVITTICDKGNSHICYEEIPKSESKPMDIF